MGTAIVGAIIGAVLAAPLTLWLQHLLPRIKAKRAGIPDIVGQWQGTWYVEANGGETQYNTDTIKIEKQSGFKVFGRGTDEKGTYQLTGEFSSVAVACFSYRYEKGWSALTGVIILDIDPSEKKGEGWWYGYTKEKKVQGGRVIWEKIV